MALMPKRGRVSRQAHRRKAKNKAKAKRHGKVSHRQKRGRYI